jgi:hypothetical protein
MIINPKNAETSITTVVNTYIELYPLENISKHMSEYYIDPSTYLYMYILYVEDQKHRTPVRRR